MHESLIRKVTLGFFFNMSQKTPADPKHEIDKSYTYGKLFFLWI